MIIYLFLILLFLIIFTFLIFKHNVFSPTMMLIFGYFLSSFFYLINYEKWGVDISLNTIYIIVLSILIFLIIEVFTMNIIGHKRL